MFAMGPAFFSKAGFSMLTLTGAYAAATIGTAYSSDLAISGGNGSYMLTGGTGVSSGSLPAGLSLSIVGGALRLSGTPTGTAGTVSFTASVGSGDGQTATSPQSVVVSVSSITTWNPSDKNSHITLTTFGGVANTGFASSGSSIWCATRATLARDAATSNHYFELNSTQNFAMAGLMSGANTLADGVFPGADTTGYGFYFNSGAAYNNNTPHTYGTSVSSGTIGVLLKNGKLYFRSPTGAWYNSGDPVAETGWAFSGLTGMLFPAVGVFVGAGGSGRFATAGFTLGTLPSGTQPWGT